MERSKWFLHPIVIFIFSLSALATSLSLYIHWYLKVSGELENFVKKFNLNPDQFLQSQTWVIILTLSILVAIIVLGMFLIFAYYYKTIQLYRLQRNFINNFTHELKTPVASIQLFLDTFVRHELTRDEQLKYIKYMLRDTARLNENIERILNLTKLENKRYVKKFLNLDLVEIINQFLRGNSHLFENCAIKMHNVAKWQFFYPVNPALFEMLISNLLSNAIKYNNSDRPRIDISLQRQKNNFLIMFKDNGSGLEKTELKKIFKLFYQVGDAADMSAKGSGLGLHLVQSVMKIHRGKISVESSGVNLGSTFILSFPLNKKAGVLNDGC